MIKTILVPVDYHDLAIPAVQAGVALARTCGAHVHLLYVVPDNLLTCLGSAPNDSRPFLEDMIEYLARIGLDYPDVTTHKLVMNGKTAPVILDHARDIQSDVIVIATHARHGLQRWVMGSVAEDLMHGAHCPVMIIRVSTDDAPGIKARSSSMMAFKKILVPVDSSEYAKAALKYAVELARGTGAEIIALHVVPVVITPSTFIAPLGGYADGYPENMTAAREYMEALKPMLADVASRTVICTGEPGAEIVTAAAEEGVDIIVMATHGRSGLSRLLMGSTTEAVMRHATVPVITLRAAVLLKAEAPPEPIARMNSV